MKKLILLLAFLCITTKSVLAQSIVISGNCGENESNVTYVLTSDSVLTISGSGDLSNYNIVKYYDFTPPSNYPNTSPWGAYKDAITTIVIDENITALGDGAFAGCNNLTTVYFNAVNCTYAGSYGSGDNLGMYYTNDGRAFGGCNNLTEVYFGNSVENIPNMAFINCENLKTVTLPNSLTTIGNAFEGCRGLTSITLPNSVLYIGVGAFNDTGLTSVTIPESLEFIGSAAFGSCRNLMTVNFNALNCATNGSAFFGCDNLREVNFGNKVTQIPDNAFENCSGLSSVTISNSVTTIGAQAFLQAGLTSITIPEAVTTVGDNAFQYCYNLTTVNFNAINCSYMGESNLPFTGFSSCDNFTELNIGNKVTRIPDNAFPNCKGLKSVIIPESVTAIGDYAFSSCSGLTSMILPDNVTTIGNFAFSDCSGLTSVNIPESVTTIGGYAFAYNGITSVTIPETVTAIGYYAFEYCTNLTTANFNAINCNYMNNVFLYGCNNLTELNIGNKVTRIPDTAFQGCSGLTSVTIPESVKSVGLVAFADCSNLKYITCNAIYPPALGSYAFLNVPTNIPVYVPCGSYTDYQNAWTSFPNFVEHCQDVTPAENSVIISWTPIDNATYYEVIVYADDAHTQVIGHYKVDALGNVTTMRAANDQNDLSLSIEGLTANTQYYFTIASYDSNDVEIVTFPGDFSTAANSGIENIAANQINIYPNPAKDDVFIKSELPLKKIEICSLTGALVLSENNFNGKISVFTLPQGVYLLKVQTDNGLITRKIVKD